MLKERSYLKVQELILDSLGEEDVENSVSLIENSIKLITNEPLLKVISSIDVKFITEGSSTRGDKRFDLREDSGVRIVLDVKHRWRPLVFGRKFANIQSLRKLVSNLSGKAGREILLTVVEN